tara:strand:+ start:1416 stop:1610 length:195 start_codon:yes stop_codon:yes gene_type:complete
MEMMTYLVCKHYGMKPTEVWQMGIDELRMCVSWARAMQKEEVPTIKGAQGEIVRLGYDNVPEVE